MITLCKECSKPFSNTTPCNTWVDIRGRVKCWDCKPYNTGNRKALSNQTSKRCSYCTLDLPVDDFYFRSHTGRRTRTTYCKTCLLKYNKQKDLEFKIKLILLKGGCCQSCGYKKNICSLDFHHREQESKDFNLAHTGSVSAKVLAELDKCDLLCSNCHREIHNPTKNHLL